MKRISLVCLVLVGCGALSLVRAQGVSKCFRAEWLQGERTINVTIKGSQVSGTFSVGADDHSPDRVYGFTGTRRANTFNVAFADDQLPDVAPSEMKSLTWSLVQARGQESLRIQFYGKNYQTNKYETSFAYFKPCPGNYAVKAGQAETVQFAKGANSANVQLQSRAEFQAMTEPAVFLIKAAKGQTLEINAAGCSVEVYLPNKTRYQFVEWANTTEKTFASTRLDGMSIDSLPSSGAYLVVLRKAAESMRPETVTFKITN